MTDAPRTTEEAAAFIKRQHLIESYAWKSMCLSLQRQARGLPAVYPSALSAANATPESERVHKVTDLRRGMVAYSDHPSDSNPFGHIYFVAGWRTKEKTDPENLNVWTNLADGTVGIVPITFFLKNWGDPFQFGATWLNGYNFSEFDAAPKPDEGRDHRLGNLQHGIEDVQRAIRFHEKRGHLALVAALRNDLAAMQETLAKFGG